MGIVILRHSSSTAPAWRGERRDTWHYSSCRWLSSFILTLVSSVLQTCNHRKFGGKLISLLELNSSVVLLHPYSPHTLLPPPSIFQPRIFKIGRVVKMTHIKYIICSIKTISFLSGFPTLNSFDLFVVWIEFCLLYFYNPFSEFSVVCKTNVIWFGVGKCFQDDWKKFQS